MSNKKDVIMKLKNIYLALVLLFGVSLTSFGQTTPPELPEMFNLTIKTSEMADNDCSPIVQDYLDVYHHSYAMTYGAYVKQTPKAAESFTIGVNTVTLKLYDVVGPFWNPSSILVDEEEFTVTVIDDTNPTVTSNNFIQNLYVDNGKCTASIPDLRSIDVGLYFDDNSTPCLGHEELLFVSQNPLAGSALPIGVNKITITAEDKYGNEATATTIITVIDNEGPLMTEIPNLRIRNSGNECYASMPDVSDHVRTNFVSDCSGEGVITQIPAKGDMIELGVHSVHITMADGVGNETSQDFDIEVFDDTAPIITLKDYLPFTLNPNTVRVNWFNIVSATDNCDRRVAGSIVKGNGEGDTNGADGYVTFDCCELGENTVTVTVTDNFGNESSVTTTVLIYDDIAPVVHYRGSREQTLYTTATTDKCEAVIPDLRGLIEGQVSDNCDECSTSNFTYVQKYTTDGDQWFDWTEGTLIYGDNNKVALFAEDNVKNLSEPVIINLIIEDKTGPVLVLRDITLNLDADGFARMKFTDVYDRENSSDNCSYIAESDTYWEGEWHDQDYYYTFDCSNMGVSFTQEFQVRDWAGNMSNVAVTNITIIDEVAPELSTHNYILKLDENGAGTINPLNFVYSPPNRWSVTDNCTASADIDLKIAEGGLTTHPDVNDSALWFDEIDYACADIGKYYIWVKATDESGNITVKRDKLVVKDRMNPIIAGQDVVLQVSPEGLVNLNVMQIENGSIDNCEIDFYTITKVDGHPTNMQDQDMGVQNYMFSTCYGNGHDEAYYAEAMASLSKMQDEDCCGGLGMHEVEYTVVDKSNNRSIVNVNVRILEHIIARAKDELHIAIPSNGYLYASDINDNSTDCLGDNIFTIYRVDNAVDDEPTATGSLTLTCNDFMFDDNGDPMGLNVMLKVQENHSEGEVSFAQSMVYFYDEIAPVAMAHNELEITLDENNLYTLTADEIDNGSSDNSGCITKTIYLEIEGQVVESGEINFTEDHIGQTLNVILRVVDKFGNEDYSNTVVSIFAGTGKALSTEAMEVAKFTVYPNPTTSMLFISNNDNTNMHVRLYNLTGKLVLEHSSFASKVKLNVSGIDDGLYLIQIMSNNQLIVSKRIIKK